MQINQSIYIYRLLCLVLGAVIVTISCLGIGQLHKGFPVETNLQTLFPQDEQDLVTQRINQELTQAFGNQIILAVQAPTDDAAEQVGQQIENEIQTTNFLTLRSQDDFSSQLASQLQQLTSYRFQLLSPKQRAALLEQDTQLITEHAQNVLLGFNPNPLALPFIQDPLDLFSGYVNSLQPAVAGEIKNNRLMIRTGNASVVLIPVVLRGDSFSLDVQEQLNNWIITLKQNLAKNQETYQVKLLTSGVIFHAARASQKAQAEINWLGAFDIGGTLIVFILTFFSIRPLLLTLCSIGFGSLAAVVVNLVLFEKIHLIALVFGTSLIGVAIDYSVHYLCKHQAMFDPAHAKASSQTIIQKLMPALIMGLLTSLIGYACLFQAPLPGLKQIASFSVVGLSAAWLFVVVAFPILMRKSMRLPHVSIDRLSFFSWQFWTCYPKKFRLFTVALLIFIAIAGMVKLQQSTDIRLLYKPDSDLLDSEKALQELMQSISPNQYYLLSATSAEALLNKEEIFRATVLDPLVAKGYLHAYVATSQWVPSINRQTENYQLIKQQLYRKDGAVETFLRSAGFDENLLYETQQQFETAEQQRLIPETFFEHARADQRLLWLGKINQSYVSIIALRGITNAEQLAAFPPMEGVRWVNRIGDMSSLLKSLGSTALRMLAFAYLAIACLVVLFYRKPKALWLLAVPLSSSILALALLSLAGVPISLFHIFALYLIMGMGMDYAIFSYNEGLKDPISQRSIFLSALTSAMSFGMLSFSSTPMIQAFGSVMLIGSLLNLFLAPLVGYLTPAANSRKQR